MDKEELARLVKEGRTARGYTQQELSDKTGLSLRSVQRIENGEVVPRSYTIRVLAEELGFEVASSRSGGSPSAFEPLSSIEPGTSVPPPIPLRSSSPRRPRKIILTTGLGIILVLGAMAFLAQSPRFPETTFEALLFWLCIVVVYTVALLFIWK